MTQRVKSPLQRTQRHSESPRCFIVDLVLLLHTLSLNCVQKSQCVFQEVERMKDATIIVGTTLVSTMDGACIIPVSLIYGQQLCRDFFDKGRCAFQCWSGPLPLPHSAVIFIQNR